MSIWDIIFMGGIAYVIVIAIDAYWEMMRLIEEDDE